MTKCVHQIPTVRPGKDHVKKSFGQHMINAASSHVSKVTPLRSVPLPFLA